MLTLLAESKTMLMEQSEVTASDFNLYKPVLEDTADMILSYLADLSPNQIAENLGISNSLAIKAHNLAYDFPYKQTGIKTIYAFIGDAYRGLDIKTLSSDIVKNSDTSLRIISSVYGILKPSDIIKPYRCEFNKPITKENKTAVQIFKQKITVDLVNYIKKNKVNDIINLLPGDADKCLDWKIIRAFVPVHKVVFQTFDSKGRLKTPIAKRLKELRGLMTRCILEQDIQSFKDLQKVKSEEFIFSPVDSKPLLPVFITS